MAASWTVTHPDGTVYAQGTSRTTLGALMQGTIGAFFARRAWRRRGA